MRSLIPLMLLTACATGAPSQWTRDAWTQPDLERDRYTCTQEARVGIAAPTDGTRLFFGGDNRMAQAEANRLFTMCMQARGWRPSQ